MTRHLILMLSSTYTTSSTSYENITSSLSYVYENEGFDPDVSSGYVVIPETGLYYIKFQIQADSSDLSTGDRIWWNYRDDVYTTWGLDETQTVIEQNYTSPNYMDDLCGHLFLPKDTKLYFQVRSLDGYVDFMSNSKTLNETHVQLFKMH